VELRSPNEPLINSDFIRKFHKNGTAGGIKRLDCKCWKTSRLPIAFQTGSAKRFRAPEASLKIH
jgi:hypothetical protein